MPDPADLLSTYRDALERLRKGVGPAGVLVAPLQMSADILDGVLSRQQALEKRLEEALKSLDDVYELARDAPAALRTQATAFSAASASFEQAAKVMNAQADLLERTQSAFEVPARLLRRS